jgi:hypothetical protein
MSPAFVFAVAFGVTFNVVHADNHYISAQYRSSTCDVALVNLFESTPQSACVSNGGSYKFWNCSNPSSPSIYQCGSDSTCRTGCKPFGQPVNTSACIEYPIPGKYSGIWAGGFCATEEIPFKVPTLVTRKYFSAVGCQSASAGDLRSLLGEAIYCVNLTNSGGIGSAMKTCSLSAGELTTQQFACPKTDTCTPTSLCLPVGTTKGRTCVLERAGGFALYVTDSCNAASSSPSSSSSPPGPGTVTPTVALVSDATSSSTTITTVANNCLFITLFALFLI